MDETKISGSIKTTISKEINQKLSDLNSLILVGYSGLTAPEMDVLRSRLRNNNASMVVVKNTLSRRLFKEKRFEALIDSVEGPLGIIFVKDEPVAVSKVLVDFARNHKALTLKAGLSNQTLLTIQDLEALSRLPAKEVLLAKAVYGIKAPLNNFGHILRSLLQKTVLVLKAVADKKQ